MPEEDRLRPSGVWGPWTTLLWGVLILALSLAAQLVCAGLYVGALGRRQSWEQILDAIADVQFDGGFIAVAMFVSTAFTAALIVAIVMARRGVTARRGADLKDYLGLSLPGPRAALGWLVAMAVLIVVYDGASSLSGHAVVPDFMSKSYGSARSPLVFFLALVLAAPIGEELLFRGFLLKGLAVSRLGPYGATALTAAAWAMLHGQYGAYEIASIFVIGIVLGLCRLRTGSTLLTMGLHGFANTVALVETVIHLRGGPV